jgi:sterol desaturase/sphingolipid hydroxylase (fatty acid hydroxylase superfamily)
MNPLNWKREHQVALCVGTVVGIVVGALIGYATTPASNHMFANWLANKAWPDTGWWALICGFVGAGIVYVRQLLRA